MSKPALANTDADAPLPKEQPMLPRADEAGPDLDAERSRMIVDAAYELLDEEGLEGLTIRAVLTRTGLSRRAFYERFEGKDDLVLAVFEATIHKAVQLFTELTSKIADPMERLRLIVTFIVLGKAMQDGDAANHSDRRGAALSREHLRLAESRPADLKAALEPLIALIVRQLADGMQAGRVRQDDPQRLATLLYNLVSTTVHTELLTAEGIRTQAAKVQLASDIWEFCRRAIEAS